MKNIKLSSIVVLLLTMLFITSCIDDEKDDFDTPDLTIVDPNIENVISITAIAGIAAQQDEDETFTFEDTNNYVSGFVISSDEGGNFFEELIIQDKLENPTTGVRILLDVNPLFTNFSLGRKIFIKLNDLSVGISNGVLTLGIVDSDGRLQKIPESQLDEFVIKSPEIGTIVPLPITLDIILDSQTNLFVGINDVQFSAIHFKENPNITLAAEPLDEFGGERILQNCSQGSMILSTSTFADFKSLRLPIKRGYIQGVLTKNFFGDTFNLSVNFSSDLIFDSLEERCDFFCDDLDTEIIDVDGLINTIFSDDFESQTENQPIQGNGWTNYIEIGSTTWEAYDSGGANASLGTSAHVSSRNSSDEKSIAWLITPEIDLDLQVNEVFNFKTSNSFSDGSTLEVFISSNWDGNEDTITTADWRFLLQSTIVTDDDFFGDWITSNTVDLSCETGNVYIAFKYVGIDQDNADGTYELDEINIKF